MSGPTTALLLLALTAVTLGQQYYPYAQYVAPYTGMYGLSGHYGQYGYGAPSSYAYPYYNAYFGRQQQSGAPYTGMGSSDMRHSGTDLNGFWLMCTSKNCGRGRK